MQLKYRNPQSPIVEILRFQHEALKRRAEPSTCKSTLAIHKNGVQRHGRPGDRMVQFIGFRFRI